MKYLLILLFSISAYAGEICYDESQTTFSTTGKHCVNPWNAVDPSIGVAQDNADSAANKLCYPFQAVRLGGYTTLDDSECRIATFGVRVSADYQCAR